MKGEITVRIEGAMRRFPVERISATPKFELFRIRGRNGSIVFQSNRPLLRGNGLKLKRIDWKLVEGSLRNAYTTELVSNSLDEYVRNLEKQGKL